MIIYDDVQHFVDRRDSNALPAVSNWLKTLVKDAKIACVLVGLQDQAEEVIRVNRQFSDLFGDPCLLEPFDWPYLDPQAREATDFQKFLRQLEELLPFNKPSVLSEPTLAWRCFVASDGILRLLMRLIRGASYLALTQGGEHLTMEWLAKAFEEELGEIQRGMSNPFTSDELPKRKPVPRSQPGIPEGTNNRSQPRQESKEHVQDLVK